MWDNVGSLGPLVRPTTQAARSESLICIPKEWAEALRTQWQETDREENTKIGQMKGSEALRDPFLAAITGNNCPISAARSSGS
jgi:hypothetical protein